MAGAAPVSSRDRAQAFCGDAPSDNAKVFKVLIGQVGKDREINAVFGKALRVLGHAELFEPIRNLLHGAKPTRPRRCDEDIPANLRRELAQFVLSCSSNGTEISAPAPRALARVGPGKRCYKELQSTYVRSM